MEIGKKTTPRVYITDIGNVLVNFEYQYRSKSFCDQCEASPEEIKSFFGSETFHEHERGLLDDLPFFEILKREVGYRQDFAFFKPHFCETFSLNKEVFELTFQTLKHYSAVQEIWDLSNLNRIHKEAINARWPGIFSGCRRQFISCDVHMRKPDREMYEAVASKLDDLSIAADQACFVDDLEENCLAAHELGIDYIHFKNVAQLREELVSRNPRIV